MIQLNQKQEIKTMLRLKDSSKQLSYTHVNASNWRNINEDPKCN